MIIPATTPNAWRSKLHVAGAFVFVFGFVGPALADCVHLTFEAPRECPTADEFFQAVRTREPRVRRSPAPKDDARCAGAPVALRIDVGVRESGFEGRAQLSTGAGWTEERFVAAASCDEVVAALALSSALGLGLMFAEEPPDGAVPQRSEPQHDAANEPAAADGSRPQGASNGGEDRLVLGAFALGVNPVDSLLWGGGADVTWQRSSGWGLGALAAGVAWAGGEDTNISYEWLVGALRLCPVTRYEGRWSFEFCVASHLGALQAVGRGVSRPVSVSRFWADAGLSGGVAVRLAGALGVRVQGWGTHPFTRRDFVFAEPHAVVGRSRAVFVGGEAGLVLGF